LEIGFIFFESFLFEFLLRKSTRSGLYFFNFVFFVIFWTGFAFWEIFEFLGFVDFFLLGGIYEVKGCYTLDFSFKTSENFFFLAPVALAKENMVLF
jgi:hypothetical protein